MLLLSNSIYYIKKSYYNLKLFVTIYLLKLKVKYGNIHPKVGRVSVALSLPRQHQPGKMQSLITILHYYVRVARGRFGQPTREVCLVTIFCPLHRQPKPQPAGDTTFYRVGNMFSPLCSVIICCCIFPFTNFLHANAAAQLEYISNIAFL